MASQFLDDQKTREPEDLLPSSQSLGLAKEIDHRPEGDDMVQEGGGDVEKRWGKSPAIRGSCHGYHPSSLP
jgi:hypothetical protein